MRQRSLHIHHPAVTAYLDHLRAAGRASTAEAYRYYLRRFEQWLARAAGGVDLLQVATEHLIQYQLALSTDRTVSGEPLAASTRATAIIIVQACFAWLAQAGILVRDPAAGLIRPAPPRRLAVTADHLTLQEATALVQTAAALADEAPAGSWRRALALRNLALVALALATGRRRTGLVRIRVAELDVDRHELRVPAEKGSTGRVLPVAGWAVAAARRYMTEARPQLLGARSSEQLLIGRDAAGLRAASVWPILQAVVTETIRRNPDLAELSHKRVSPHSLRVSFATLLFHNGCPIRSLNELMLHRRLSTSAAYTPVAVEDLRRALRTTHPRA